MFVSLRCACSVCYVNHKFMATRNRNWTFCWHGYNDEDYERVLATDCAYVVVGKELGEEGKTPHLQGYIVMKSVKSLKQMKELWDTRIHWEAARGDSAANLVYCSKEGEWEERGTRPATQKEKGLKGAEKWQEILREAKETGEVSDPWVAFKNHKEVHHHYTLAKGKTLVDLDGELEHVWYWGPTGTGKSRTAMGENPGAYRKSKTKWWNMYDYQDVVVIDDLGPHHRDIVDNLKEWADRYVFPAEFKGGEMLIRPKKFVVTSNFPPKGIWHLEEDWGPIERKFKVIKLG